MAADEMAEQVSRLYALDPAGFTAERNAVVKALKKAKRTDEADFIGGLRKPSAVEHALNTVAREKAHIVAQWVKAVTRAVEAQASTIGGGSGASFREATAELRAASGAVVNAALEALGEGETKRLQIAAAVQALSVGNGPGLLAGAVVGSAPVEADADIFAGAPDPPARSTKASTKAVRGPSRADMAKRKRLEEKRTEATVEVENASAAIRSAERKLAAAQAKLEQLEDELRALDD